MKRLSNVQAEMRLHVPAYNMKRAIKVPGVAKIMNTCKGPERVRLSNAGTPDYTEATNYFIGNCAEHFGASAANSLGHTKIPLVF